MQKSTTLLLKNGTKGVTSMDGEIFQRENITRVSAQYRHIERVNLLSDRLQKLILVGAVLSLIAAVVLTFLHCNGMVCTALAVVLLWIRPVSFLLRKKKVDGEIKTAFEECGFVQTSNLETVRYRYDEIKHVMIFDNWIVFKMRRKRILLDANGFVFLTTENLVEFLRKNYPKISVKRKKAHDSTRYYRAVILATIFSIVVTTAAVYVRQRIDAPSMVKSDGAKELLTTELPEAEAWEDPTEPEDAVILKLLFTEDISLFVPTSFIQQPADNGELFLIDNKGTTVRVLTAEKSNFAWATSQEEIFESILGMYEDPNGMAQFGTDEFGRLTYTFGYGITSETHAVFLEAESRYVVVVFRGLWIPGSFTMKDFVEWGNMIDVQD